MSEKPVAMVLLTAEQLEELLQRAVEQGAKRVLSCNDEQPRTKVPRVLLSIAELGKRYGVGRIQTKKLIADGSLPAVERTARGGRLGSFVRVEDADRVLAGIAAKRGNRG